MGAHRLNISYPSERTGSLEEKIEGHLTSVVAQGSWQHISYDCLVTFHLQTTDVDMDGSNSRHAVWVISRVCRQIFPSEDLKSR